MNGIIDSFSIIEGFVDVLELYKYIILEASY